MGVAEARRPIHPAGAHDRAPAAGQSEHAEHSWISVERQLQARELHMSKIRAEAEASLALKAAFDFMAKHGSSGAGAPAHLSGKLGELSPWTPPPANRIWTKTG
jgi:hypothetical protein